jgi:NADH-quinone oxidoreductase subunit L
VLGAAITAFYMTRLFFMTFGGRRPRWTDDQHPHEGSPLMWWPLVFLGVGSAALGAVLGIGGTFTTWLEPVVGHAEHHEPVLPVPVIMTVTILVVVLGALLAFRMYAVNVVPEEAPRGSVLTRAARRDLYQDAANETLVMLPALGLARVVEAGDREVVDRGWAALPQTVSWFGSVFRRAQSGYVRSYAAGMAGGVLVIAVVAWLVVGLGGAQ